MLGSGSRIPLRFDPVIKIRGCAKGAGGLGLFPGSIVALKGRNGGGGWFQVSEVLGVSVHKNRVGNAINSYPQVAAPSSNALLWTVDVQSRLGHAHFAIHNGYSLWTIYLGHGSAICTPEAFFRADQECKAKCCVIGKEPTCIQLLFLILSRWVHL